MNFLTSLSDYRRGRGPSIGPHVVARNQKGASAMTAEEARWDRHRILGDGVLSLDAEDLRLLLPLSKDRILIDRVLSLEPGEMAVAQKAVSGGDVSAVGEKNKFVFPSTTAMTALEQLSLVVLLAAVDPPSTTPSVWKSGQGTKIPHLTEIETLEVDSEMVVPGILHLRAHLVREIDDANNLFEGGVSVGGVDFIRARWVMGSGSE